MNIKSILISIPIIIIGLTIIIVRHAITSTATNPFIKAIRDWEWVVDILFIIILFAGIKIHSLIKGETT